MLPRFTPGGVAAIAQWSVVALISYWLLTIILRLLNWVLNWVFLVVKTVLVLSLFGLIATDETASTDTTAVRVFGLVLGCVFWNFGSVKTSSVESRLSFLEARLKAVEEKKTTVTREGGGERMMVG